MTRYAATTKYSGCQKFLRFGFDVERSACLKTPPGSLLQPGYSNNSHGSLNLAMEAAALRGCIKVILFYSNCRTLEPNSALYPMKIIGKLKRLLAIAIDGLFTKLSSKNLKIQDIYINLE